MPGLRSGWKPRSQPPWRRADGRSGSRDSAAGVTRAESIEAAIREIYSEFSSRIAAGFIVCEDGSKDNTNEILCRLAKELPLRLNLSDTRKGYSRAVREGAVHRFRRAMRPQGFLAILGRAKELRRGAWVACGPGRYDSAEDVFALLLPAVPDHSGGGNWGPCSRASGGNSWRACIAAVKEPPVHHRLRPAGETQVYKWQKMPGIFFKHVAALFRIRSETGKS